MKISNNDYKPKFNETIDNKDVINDSKPTKENLESLSKEIDSKLNSILERKKINLNQF
ncbi:Uncharacterised protein [Proteus vulgaris]|uniref:hypothetical protein n=1 Tax=Proteus vulgaris TaxID=585 RepID=UPI000DFF2E2B|nr:hypothetical protein [Proteus vulgaris]SUC13577.1 Uncharacterised protein [Proteus vulgaris]